MLLEAVSRKIDDHCERHFYAETATKYYDGDISAGRALDKYTEEVTEYGCRLWVEDLLSVTSIGMDSDGDGDWEDTLATTDYILWPYNAWPKVRIDLDLRQGDYSYWVHGQQAVKVVGLWGYGDGDSATPYTSSGATVTVATAAGTTVTASDGGAFLIGQTAMAGTEQMYITGVSGNELTVVRGVNGTTAAVQAAATAYIYQYPAEVREACLLQTARLWERKDTPLGVQMGSTVAGIVSIKVPSLDPDVVYLLQAFVRQVGYKGAVT
jgi:hypothetical protein